MVKVFGDHIKVIVKTQYIVNNMTDQEILKFGEIQYLKGRLDELYKAIPTITNMERRRKLDQRIEKYINKLKKVDEVAYRLYEVELNARHRVKVKGKLETENLLNEILNSEMITDENLIKKIKDKLETF
jgi:ferritin-like metal-binding protein YciE